MKNLPLKTVLCALVLAFLCDACKTSEPIPYGPLPSPSQVAWQQMEVNMFCHFGPNTFTGEEWGSGKETEDTFNPTAMDCNQWVSVAKQAGMKGVIITAKHHDGFCLWPNPMSNHTVAQSSWKAGKGDVVKELSEACKKSGVKMGVYVSPWDRNDPAYGTTDYNAKFQRTLEHIHTNYGDIFEQWFDGANGEGPNGKKQIYDWPLFNTTVLSRHPECVIFSDIGPGCRWIGNEEGKAGLTCWSTLSAEGFAPGVKTPTQDTLNHGNTYGSSWIPGEVDVSIRPGWFWRSSEHPKTLQQLLKIYYTSVGRNGLLLLNVPPDSRGLIPAEDSIRLVEFREALNTIFAHDIAKEAKVTAAHPRGFRYGAGRLTDGRYDSYYATPEGVTSDTIMLTFDTPQTFNRIVLQEYIPLGQRVEEYQVEVLHDGRWVSLAEATTIGYKRILLTPTTTTTQLRLVVLKSRGCIVLNNLSVYLDTIYQGDF